MKGIWRRILALFLLLLAMAAVGCGKTQKAADISKAKVKERTNGPDKLVLVDSARPLCIDNVTYYVKSNVGSLYAREGDQETLLVKGSGLFTSYYFLGEYVFYEYEEEKAGKIVESVCCAKLQDMAHTASYTVTLDKKDDDFDLIFLEAVDEKRERIYVQHNNELITLDFSCQEIRSDTFEEEPLSVLVDDDAVYVLTGTSLYQSERDGSYKKQATLSEGLQSADTELCFRYGDYLYGEVGEPAHTFLMYSYVQISVKTGKVTYMNGNRFEGWTTQWDEEHHLIYFVESNDDTWEDEVVELRLAENGTYQKKTYPVPMGAVRDRKIYYKDKNSLMCYDMDSKEKTVIWKMDKKGYYLGDVSIYDVDYIRIIGDTMYYTVFDCRHGQKDRYGAYLAERTLLYVYSFQDKSVSCLSDVTYPMEELEIETMVEQRDRWMAVLENTEVTDIRFGVKDCNGNQLSEIYAEGLDKDGQVVEYLLYEYCVAGERLTLIPQEEMEWPAVEPDDVEPDIEGAEFESREIVLSSEEAQKLSDTKLKEKLSVAIEEWEDENF